MIASCNCPITANCPITLSEYNFAEKLEQNTPVYAPITCEEIVIVMINEGIGLSEFFFIDFMLRLKKSN